MMPRLLVISPPCHEPVNRAVYRELAVRGIAVHLVVPKRHFVGGAWRDTRMVPAEGYELSHLDIRGRNLRLQRLVGLRSVVAGFAPSHVFVDADPASLLVLQAALAASGARLSALTAENMAFDARARLGEALSGGSLKGIVNVLAKTFMRVLSRTRLDRVFTLSDEGSRVVRRVRYMPKPLIQKIGPKEIPPRWMEWVEESTLDRGAKTVTFQNRPTTQKIANLLVNQGTMQFRSKGAKTERVLKGELKVKVFLLGKIAEKFIYNQASRILEEEARALNKFIQSRSA